MGDERPEAMAAPDSPAGLGGWQHVTAAPLGAGLALMAAISFGFGALSVKYGLEATARSVGERPTIAAAFISVLVNTLLFWGLVVMQGIPAGEMTLWLVLPFVLIGVLYPAVFRLTYYRGIDSVGPSIAGAIVGANPAVAVILSILFLGEQVSAIAAIGVLCIVGGGGLLNLARDTVEGTPDDVIRLRLVEADSTDLLAPVVAMLAVSVGFVGIDYGLVRFSFPVIATAITQTAGLAALGAALALTDGAPEQLRTATRSRRGFAFFVLAGVLGAVGWLAQFLAFEIGSVVTTVPLINTFPLVIVGVTYLEARQPPRSPWVIGGILAIVAGATVVRLA